jgi:hypothetical protein
MKARIEGNKLIVEVDINPHRSASGKNLVIASSAGNKVTTAIYEGKCVIVGVNAYVKD